MPVKNVSVSLGLVVALKITLCVNDSDGEH